MTANNQVAEASVKYLSVAAGQAVPVGYKKTEVGVIPEDWIAKELGEFVTISSGESPSKFQFLSEGLPYFKVEQLNNGSVYAEETPYFINSPKSVPAGSVIFPKRGASILSNKIRILKSDSFMDTNLMALTCSKSLSELYLYNQLSYRGLDSVADTTSIPQINNKHIVPYRIPYPKLEEQTAIANALSDVDALINEVEKLIVKKQAIKTATMQQLLTGRTRLPQFALREDGTKKGYKQSELEEIPEDWEVATLGEIGQCVIGLTYSPNNVADFGTLVLRSSNVQGNRLAYEDNVYVQMDLPERVIVKKGDILVCVRNGSRQLIGKCALIDAKDEGSAFGAFMSVFRTQSYGFVFYQFQSDIIQNQINEIMGATINQITNKDMGGFKIPLPKLEEEHTAIATILSDMDAEIQTLQQRLSKTRQIKQGMMQELLTGKIRLIKPEPSISANVSKEYAHE